MRRDSFGPIAFVCVLYVAFVLALGLLVQNAHAETELQAEARLAEKYHAKQEVCLDGGERVDLLNDTHAIEIEWCKSSKLWEAIGQAIYYAHETNRKPAVILLVSNEREQAGLVATMQRRCERMGITLYLERATPNYRKR